MITVRGRELVIPVAERQIGTQFDNNSETRQFKINRLTVGGIDISNLDFRIDLRYGKETKDTDVLEKEITDEHVDIDMDRECCKCTADRHGMDRSSWI